MAVVQNPVINRASGTLGSNVFSKWRKKNILRTKPLTVTQPGTTEQLENWAKFKFLSELSLNPYYMEGYYFSAYKNEMSKNNAFIKRNMHLPEDVPASFATEDMPSVIWSAGNLPPVSLYYLDIAGNDISVTVKAWLLEEDIEETDLVGNLIIFHYESQSFIILHHSAGDCWSWINEPANFAGAGTYFFYYTYYNSVTKQTSDTLYIGSAELSA